MVETNIQIIDAFTNFGSTDTKKMLVKKILVKPYEHIIVFEDEKYEKDKKGVEEEERNEFLSCGLLLFD